MFVGCTWHVVTLWRRSVGRGVRVPQRPGAGEEGVVERAARVWEEEAAARAARVREDYGEVAGLTPPSSFFGESLMRSLMAPFDQGESDSVHACFQQHLQDTAWEYFAENAEGGVDGNIIGDGPPSSVVGCLV